MKVPLVYTIVALKNWQAFKKLGINGVIVARHVSHRRSRWNMPTRDRRLQPAPKTADDPILVRMTRTPCKPGLPSRDQHRAGHADLFDTPFATFERNIRDQFARMLGDGGFDPARDIDAITVNRWPHGYAYEYNPLWDRGLAGRGSRRASSDASRLAGSRSPIPTRPPPRTPIRRSIRRIARSQSSRPARRRLMLRPPSLRGAA